MDGQYYPFKLPIYLFSEKWLSCPERYRTTARVLLEGQHAPELSP